jgi:DNA-binding transcriptional LysR family regulator
VASGELLPVSIPGWVPVPDTIHVVWPETPVLPLKLRRLVELLAARIAEPFGWDAALPASALPAAPETV